MTEQEYLQLMQEKREYIRGHQEKHGSIYALPDDYEFIPDEVIEGMGDLLLSKETDLSIKDDILMQFAHQHSKVVLDFLRKYKKNPDNDVLRFIAETTHWECK